MNNQKTTGKSFSILTSDEFALEILPRLYSTVDTRENKLSRFIKLEAYDRKYMEEISTAMNVFADEKNGTEMVGEVTNIPYGINRSVHYVQIAINFCTQFAAFNELNSKDQLTLFKVCVMDILTTRFCFLYDYELDGFVFFEVKHEGFFITKAVMSNVISE